MSWDSVKQQIAKYAPLIAPLIGGPIGAVTTLVAQVLGADDESPTAIEAAIISNPQAGMILLELQERNRACYEQMLLQADLTMFQENAANYRAELNQDDLYTKRWRPTMGYAVTFSWVITWLAVVYVLVFETGKASEVLNGLSATAVMWSIALAVLGVSVRARSKDKQVSAGKDPKGMFEGLSTLIRKQ
jgi:hypothetical protein